jgi:signal transduction histidine kinase
MQCPAPVGSKIYNMNIKKNKILLLGAGLTAIYWISDAILKGYFFGERDFRESLLAPGAYFIFIRLITSFIIIVLAAIAQSVLTRRIAAEQELSKYRGELEGLVEERTSELKAAVKRLTEEIEVRRSAEASLVENESKIRQAHGMKMVGEMAAALAHEVRNPLHALLSITEALRQDLKGNAEIDVYLHHIGQQVQRLASLMNDLLELGKPVDLEHLRRESLRAICTDVMEMWRHMAQGMDCAVNFVMPESCDDIAIVADPRRLQQVFLNLLDNAAHHSPKEAEIEFVLHAPEKDSVRITIKDSGAGIAEAVFPRIFDPFFSTRKGGIGLGLNVVKNIVESHNGNLVLSNNKPLPGCTAEVILPLAGRQNDEAMYPSG